MRPLAINIRGTNGSGKSTLVRNLLTPDIVRGCRIGGPVDLQPYASPTKKEPARLKRAEGYGFTLGSYTLGVIGPYRTACGGMDALPSFEVCQGAIEHMLGTMPRRIDTVICEGVLASTVYGSWGIFDRRLSQVFQADFAWTYLHTPVEECLRRIAQRQWDAGRERPIKEDLVRDKVRAIEATRAKAIADGRLVYDLPYGGEAEALRAIIERRADAEGLRVQ